MLDALELMREDLTRLETTVRQQSSDPSHDTERTPVASDGARIQVQTEVELLQAVAAFTTRMEDAAGLLSQIRDVIVRRGGSTGNAYDGVAELCLQHPEPKVDELRQLHAILKGGGAEAARVKRSWMLRSVRDSISSFGRPTRVNGNYWDWRFVSETGTAIRVAVIVDNGLIIGIDRL